MGLETGTYISDLVSTNPAEADGVAAGNDHIQLIKSAVKATFPNVSGAVTPTHTELNYVDGVTSAIQTQLNTITTSITDAAGGTRAITGADTAIATDAKKMLDCSGTFSLAFTAAATLGATWWCVVRNTGTGNITLDPASSEQIDGQTTGVVYPGMALRIDCTGSAFKATKLGGTRREVLTSGTTWTCPIGIRRAMVTVIGGGGSGAKGSSADAYRSGSAGGVAIAALNVSPGTAYTYSVGAGGTAVTVANNAGNNGTQSTFNTGAVTLTASPGVGGANSGVEGATLGGTATNGDINIRGGHGVLLASGNFSLGGSNIMGGGGLSDVSTLTAGVGYGYGGAAGWSTQDSGAGGDGVVIVDY